MNSNVIDSNKSIPLQSRGSAIEKQEAVLKSINSDLENEIEMVYSEPDNSSAYNQQQAHFQNEGRILAQSIETNQR